MDVSAAYLLKISCWIQRCTGLPTDDAKDLVYKAFARCFARLREQVSEQDLLRQHAAMHKEPPLSEAHWLDHQAAMEVIEH